MLPEEFSKSDNFGIKYFFTPSDTLTDGKKSEKKTIINVPMVSEESLKETNIEHSVLSIQDIMNERIALFNTWLEKGLEYIFQAKKETRADYIKKIVKEEMKHTGKFFNEQETNYWTEIIENNTNTTDTPPEVIAAIINRETKFESNVNSKTGSGPMQITSISFRDMFPSAKGSRYEIYRQIDENMMNDILYKKDDDGNFIKDDNGEYILKYKNYEELKSACTKDDDLGIKVGIMCLRMKYIETVYRMKREKNIPSTLKGLKNGSITLSDNEKRETLVNALKNYNCVFKDNYAQTVIDSIKRNNSSNIVIDFYPYSRCDIND